MQLYSRMHQLKMLNMALPKVPNRLNGVKPRYNGVFRFLDILTEHKAYLTRSLVFMTIFESYRELFHSGSFSVPCKANLG